MFAKNVKISMVNLTTTEPHIHSGMQCIFMLRGMAVIEMDDEKIHLSSEDLLVINSNQFHAVKTESSNIALVLEVERDYILSECGGIGEGNIKCYCIGHSDESSHYYGLKRALTRMLYIAVKKEACYQLDFKAEMLRFIHILFTSFRVEGENGDKRPVREKAKNISDVLTYINDNFYRPMKLEEVAKREYMSPQYFSKYFKRKTGYGFLEYLTSLRLKKAMQSLMYTDDSIVKIALDYGFANAKSFNAAFKKEYHNTPGSFRKQYLSDGNKNLNEADGVEINLEVDVELKEFMRYVKKYDINLEQTTLSKKSYDIILGDQEVKELAVHENILNIGKVETAGYTNLYKQLETLRNQLGFRYVHFELEYHFIPNDIQYSLILYNQFFRAVDQMQKLHLTPFLKIRPNDKYKLWDAEQIEADAKEKITTFLNCVCSIYSIEYLVTWKIHIVVDESFDSSVYELFYKTIYRAVKQRVPRIQIGTYAVDKSSREQYDRFQNFLDGAKENNYMPDFITFGVFPVDKKENYMATQFFYSGLRNYYLEAIDGIKSVYRKTAAEVPPLYMIEWNTLMGDLENESILYYRSAIIVEALLDLNKEIKGAGFWADSSVSTMYSGELPMSSLALYMLNDVRRPIYPVLEILKRMGTHIIHEDKNLLVSKNHPNEYNILIWNPKYLNPSYSLDDSTTEPLASNVNLKLKNMPPGIYQIKKVTCNKEHSGAITQIVNAGYPDFTDMEVFDFIQYNIANGLNVYEEYIISGTYVLNTNLLYNSVIMYVIRKKEE